MKQSFSFGFAIIKFKDYIQKKFTDIPKVVEFTNFIWKTKRTDVYARWKLKLHWYNCTICKLRLN